MGIEGYAVEGCNDCPATQEARFDGVHDGVNAGRTCWVVAGTMCGGEPQGTFAKKCINCIDCDFYQLVKEEEGANFLEPRALLSMMGEGGGRTLL